MQESISGPLLKSVASETVTFVTFIPESMCRSPYPEGSNASLLHPEAAGSRAGGSGPQPEASEASRGVIQQRLPEGSKASLLQPEAAGGRPDAGRRQAGGRPEAGRKQAGGRPDAGRKQSRRLLDRTSAESQSA